LGSWGVERKIFDSKRNTSNRRNVTKEARCAPGRGGDPFNSGILFTQVKRGISNQQMAVVKKEGLLPKSKR